VIDAAKYLGNGGGVGDHADSTHDLGKIATRDDSRRLIVDTALEASRRPVNKLDGTLGLDGRNSSVDVLRDDITTVHQTAGHVLTVTRVALDHHAGRFKDSVGDLSNRQLLVISLLSRDDGSVRGEHEVDTRVGDQVSLELSDVHVQGTIETQGGSQGRDALGDQTIEIGIGRTLNVEVTTADVIKSFIVHLASNISVLQEGVDTEDTVIRLNDSSGDLGAGPDGEGDLRLLAIVDRQTLEHQAAETGTSTTTACVEDKEALETSAVVSKLTDTVEAEVDNLLTNGVVTTGEVVGGVLLTGDELLGVEQLTVGTGTNLIDDGGLEIDEDRARHVLASSSLREEGVERVITTSNSLVRWHLTIGLDTVL